MINTRFVILLNDFAVEVMTNESTEEDARQRCLDKKAGYEKKYPDAWINGMHFHFQEVPLVAPGDEA